MNENIHCILFETFTTVSKETNTFPKDLIKRTADILKNSVYCVQPDPRLREQRPLLGVRGPGTDQVAPLVSVRVGPKLTDRDQCVNQWIEQFEEKVYGTGGIIEWYQVNKALNFYVSNIPTLNGKENDLECSVDKPDMTPEETVQKKEDLINDQIKEIKEHILCMEVCLRRREKGFGKDTPIVRLGSAPQFWVTQFTEEMDYQKNPTDQEPVTPPPSQHIPKPTPKPPKRTVWHDWCKVTKATPRYQRSYGTASYTGSSTSYGSSTSRNYYPYGRFTHDPTVSRRVVAQHDQPTPVARKTENSKSSKDTIKEIQSLIDEEVKDKTTDGIYLALTDMLKEVFDNSN